MGWLVRSRRAALLVCAIVVMSAGARAEENTTTASTTFTPSLTGGIDIRPSMTANTSDWNTENTIELGAKVSPTVAISYLQAINSNLADADGDAEGLGLYAHDGFLRVRASNLWVSADETWSLGFQLRQYAPTHAPKRDKGYITSGRHYFTLAKKLSNSVTLSGSVIPIYHIYSQPGIGTAANPAFENRFYLIADFDLGRGFSLSLPLMFHQSKARDYAAAGEGSGAWTFFAWTYPELLYAITPNYTVGLAYYSDNLVAEDLSGFAISDGLSKGVIQATFQASL